VSGWFVCVEKLTPMSALEKETEEERNFAGLNSIIFFFLSHDSDCCAQFCLFI
jgi:hypothetical protein